MQDMMSSEKNYELNYIKNTKMISTNIELKLKQNIKYHYLHFIFTFNQN